MSAPALTPRQVLAASPLVSHGGVVVTRLVEPDEHARLAAEAWACRTTATTTRIDVAPADGEIRGQPARWLDSAVGGFELAAFFTGAPVLALLATLTGLSWAPLGNQGIYSYYRRPGHNLGLHRDAPDCTVAVITCLVDDGPDAGGDLVVYPGRAAARLADIRRDPDTGAHQLRLEPGESAVLLGGLVPHRVTAVEQGRTRIVAPLCYRAATARPRGLALSA